MAPQPIQRNSLTLLENKEQNSTLGNKVAQGINESATSNQSAPFDLRAEQDEPNEENTVKLMEYLMTQVMTKTNEVRWVQRLFILNVNSISCFYESAPHLQQEGKNMLAKIVIPIKKNQSNKLIEENQ